MASLGDYRLSLSGRFELQKMKVKDAQLCPTLWDPMDCIVHEILQARILEWVAFPLLQGIFPTRGMESPALRADSFPAEPQEKPKNARVGGLSLLQGIFPTQGSNRGLLHCRRIPYQLSYQGSPWTRVRKPESSDSHCCSNSSPHSTANTTSKQM